MAAMAGFFKNRLGYNNVDEAPEQAKMANNTTSQVRPGMADYDKSDNMAFGCVGGVEDEDPQVCPFIYRLKWDLANSYYWSGHFVKDYFFFVMQWHPLLGLFMCHPNHPWGKPERFYMLMISAGITFIPSCVIAKAVAASEEYLVGDTSDAEQLAAVSEAGKKGSEMLLTILFVTLPDTILGVLLYQLAISETRCTYCPFCIPFGKCLMKYTLIFAVVIVAINLAIGYAVLSGEPPVDALMVMAKGKVVSYLTWFPIWLILPCQLGYLSLWRSEKKEAMALAAANE